MIQKSIEDDCTAIDASAPLIPLEGCPVSSQEMNVRAVIEALPEAIFTTDARGLITFYNNAAASLWGMTPQLGTIFFCGAWKLYRSDGTPLPRDESPMAMALKDTRPYRGVEAIAERPDGSRIHFLAYPSPIFNATGDLIGGVNMLIDITNQTIADEVAFRHDAIVESSDDAIIAKDLDGTILNWNRGAERLFGYAASEAIGKPVAMLIPLDRPNEEPDILLRIRHGERIEHYETIRRRKDGSLVEISLSVSPIRNREGRVIGATKIARDITERRQAEAQKNLLIREMDHRVKNLFALANSVISLSVRSVTTPGELASAVSARLSALAKAHALTISHDLGNEQSTTLHTLIQTIIAPYVGGAYNSQSRACVTGPDLTLTGSAVTGFALLLHEFATNAAKYGALSSPDGELKICCNENGGLFTIEWIESNGPIIEREPDSTGFGALLANTTVQRQFRGEIFRQWKREGLSILLMFPTRSI